MITRTFKLCLNAGTGSAPFINVSQTDKDEVWLFELYTETGERYIPSSGAIIGIKSDGHGIANTGTVDSEGRVVITETEQMTAAAGRSIFELSIDGLTHGTANFIVNVEKKPIDGAIMSDSDLSLISQAVDAAATIEDLIEGHDPDEVIADAVDAWLDAHPEATTTVEDGAITEAKLNTSVKNGVLGDMTVGTSLAVMNDEGQTDNLAYKFRPTGGDAVRELDEIVGGTIAWNQLCNSASVTVPNNHKYLMVKGGIVSIGISTGTALTGLTSGTDVVHDLTQMFGSTVADAIYAMEQSSTGSGVAYFRSLFPNAYYAYNSGELVSVEGLSAHKTVGFNQWDEEWEVGGFNSGVPSIQTDRIRSKNFIPVIGGMTYYVAGARISIPMYDANKNYLRNWNNGSFIGADDSFTVGDDVAYIKFMTAQTYGTTYNNDICINISDPAKNGTYKPYQKHTYPLDSTLTLRGVPKWNNGLYFDGDIYRHDGSVSRRYGVVDLGSLTWTYVSSSALNFRAQDDVGAKPPENAVKVPNAICSAIPVIDYTSVSTGIDGITVIFATSAQAGKIWAHNSSYTDAASFKTAMDGVYLVYELATPTAETADPYQQYQICDGKGTEEYVSETVTPVGHNTFYPVDIVSKVNKLPSDFSTLIAPTEEDFKATRNYTVNDLLIINNVLYKVTANIANGATITPNTNVSQTTLSALIKALSA